jgi:hypothetical protein
MRAIFSLVVYLVAIVCSARAQAADAGERAFYRGDYTHAAALLLPQAISGHAIAQSVLGYQYQYGLGVPKSYEQAARWYICAAEQGEPAAQFFLGQLYDRGLGVREDPVEAGKWLDLATAHAPQGKRDYWETMRETIAGKMTLDEWREAQRRAVAWFPNDICQMRSEIDLLHLPTKKYRGSEPYGER